MLRQRRRVHHIVRRMRARMVETEADGTDDMRDSSDGYAGNMLRPRKALGGSIFLSPPGLSAHHATNDYRYWTWEAHFRLRRCASCAGVVGPVPKMMHPELARQVKQLMVPGSFSVPVQPPNNGDGRNAVTRENLLEDMLRENALGLPRVGTNRRPEKSSLLKFSSIQVANSKPWGIHDLWRMGVDRPFQ